MDNLDILLDNRNCIEFLKQVRKDKNKNYILFINLRFNPFRIVPLNELLDQITRIVDKKNIFIFQELRWGELEELLLSNSEEGDVIIDLFAGDGYFGVLCKKHNRHYIGIESNTTLYKQAYKKIMEV